MNINRCSMIQQGNKFISPGAWFSMIYPSDWNEFEDGEGSFLFYNPEKWTGNFRISAYRADPKLPNANNYGQQSVKQELAENHSATVVEIGNLRCAYSKTALQENEAFYTDHLWVTGIGDVSFECRFTQSADRGSVEEAEDVIASLKVREFGEKYPAEIIPVRLMEIYQINEGYEWITSMVKNILKKDFKGVEDDLPNLQQVMESGRIEKMQKEGWIACGIALCTILTNEIDGFMWKTLIDGNREVPVLQYAKNEALIDPMQLVWSKIKRGAHCNVLEEYSRVIEEIGR